MKVLKSKAVSVTTNLKRRMLMTTFLPSYACPTVNSVTVQGQWPGPEPAKIEWSGHECI